MLGELSVSCSVRAGVLKQKQGNREGFEELKMMNIERLFVSLIGDEFKQEKEILSYILKICFSLNFST